jgi:hypothetical protein
MPAEDQVTVERGFSGSYPNFVFEIVPSEADGFVDALLAMRGDADVDRVVTRYGVRRTSPRFWAAIDDLQAEYRAQDPIEAALLDLDRYKNF